VRNWRRRPGLDNALESLAMVASPHDLLRTFGRLARMAGADLRFIQKAMSHESITRQPASTPAYDERATITAALDGCTRPGAQLERPETCPCGAHFGPCRTDRATTTARFRSSDRVPSA